MCVCVLFIAAKYFATTYYTYMLVGIYSMHIVYVVTLENSNCNISKFNFRNSPSDCSLCTVKCTQNNRSLSPSLFVDLVLLRSCRRRCYCCVHCCSTFKMEIILNHKTTYVHCCHNNKSQNFRRELTFLKGYAIN